MDRTLELILDSIDQSRLARASLRTLRRTSAAADRIEAKKAELKALLDQREELVDRYVGEISARIDRSAFRLDFAPNPLDGRKPTYSSAGNPADQFFAMKQVSRSIEQAFDIRMPNRRQIVRQLVVHLDDDFPKTILRLDVHAFFESIPHDILMKKLRRCSALSRGATTLVSQALAEFSRLAHLPSGVGLPRGLGVSSFLAEAYMQDFDRSMREDPEVFFYARFVDDIIVLYSASKPEPRTGFDNHRNAVVHRLSNLGLSPSSDVEKNYFKTLQFKGQQFSPLTYLGYEFIKVAGRLEIRLSKSRFDALMSRLQSSFAAYLRSGRTSGAAVRYLHRRVRFLTTNSRLLNTKRNAFVGIYYSNEHVNCFEQLKTLDLEFRLLAATLPDPHVRSALEAFGFEKGFANKELVRWSGDQLRSIPLIWDKK